MSEISDERLRELRNEIDNYGTGCLHEANTLVAAIDELLAARPLLEAVKGAKSALDFCIEECDGWAESIKRNLTDPDYGIALADHEKFLVESRAERRARVAVQLRRIRELVGKT